MSISVLFGMILVSVIMQASRKQLVVENDPENILFATSLDGIGSRR